jgi:hypothetical protein
MRALRILEYGRRKMQNAAHGTPLHPVSSGVWCAVSRPKIVVPTFFENTINRLTTIFLNNI